MPKRCKLCYPVSKISWNRSQIQKSIANLQNSSNNKRPQNSNKRNTGNGKNLNKKQANLLSTQWLDSNILNRPNTSNYRLKMALFSYKPRDTLVKYLRVNGWRTYGLGYQILNEVQERKAVRRLKRQFWWLKKKQNQDKPNS